VVALDGLADAEFHGGGEDFHFGDDAVAQSHRGLPFHSEGSASDLEVADVFGPVVAFAEAAHGVDEGGSVVGPVEIVVDFAAHRGASTPRRPAGAVAAADEVLLGLGGPTTAGPGTASSGLTTKPGRGTRTHLNNQETRRLHSRIDQGPAAVD